MAAQLDAKDTKRVLQTLVPGLPPAVVDYFVSSALASMSVAASQQQRRRSEEPAAFRLRRVDSGPLGSLNLLSSSPAAAGSPFQLDVGAASWSMAEGGRGAFGG